MYESFSTAALSRVAESLINKIALYSAIDRVRMQELETELAVVQMILVDRLSNENDIWLATIRMEA